METITDNQKKKMTATDLYLAMRDTFPFGKKGKRKYKTKKGDVVITSSSWEGQTLYGDITDWMRDYYSDCREVWDEAARLLIGDYVIKNSLL